MYQMDLFLDTPVRYTKEQRIKWRFQVDAFVMGLATLSIGFFLLISIVEAKHESVFMAFMIGIVACKWIPPVWSRFLLSTLLRYPWLKMKWRKRIRPFVRKIALDFRLTFDLK